jgi:microsomal dipeptidase-like Zn-dependent dipeptidase
MNRLGMIIDLSHSSMGAMVDVMTISKAPVIFSHTSGKNRLSIIRLQTKCRANEVNSVSIKCDICPCFAARTLCDTDTNISDNVLKTVVGKVCSMCAFYVQAVC